jgi:hypothetical protein
MSESVLTYTVALAPHPALSSQAVQSLTVRVARRRRRQVEQMDVLTLTYTLAGDCDRLSIPPLRPSAAVDGLWQHTCFEVFLSAQGATAYHEFNFSPSSEWAHYYFSDYRHGAPCEEKEAAPQLAIQKHERSLRLDASIRLPFPLRLQPLRLALSAVIEELSGLLSYWALRHPPGKPDFHHADAFALEIAPPRNSPRKGNTR